MGRRGPRRSGCPAMVRKALTPQLGSYACRLNGTPKSKDLNLQIQFGPDTALAILNQTWVCADTPGTPAT